MRAIKTLLTLALAIAAGAAPALATTVDEVVAKHIAARGGDAWDKIETIKISGEYTAFSETHEFTISRKRDHKYRLESGWLGGVNRVIGFDGETAWGTGRQGAQAMEGLDRAILMRSVDFATPLFDYKERGFTAKLLGEVDFDGTPAIGIELTRGEDDKETWYLDPDTYLDIGLSSPGNDYIGAVPRITFFDDFREVDGVMVPFYTESQWMTRQRIFAVEEFQTNVGIEDGVFDMPFPPGMEKLGAMVGSFEVKLETRQSPEADWQESSRTSVISKELYGALLQEEYREGSGARVVRTYSFDRFNEAYRVTQIDSSRGQLDVKQGTFDEAGKLTISNVDTGTPLKMRGQTIHSRASISDITDGGFQVEYEISTDGGENWFVNGKATYTKVMEEASNR